MYTFIVNPHSRSGKGMKTWKVVESILKEEKKLYEVHFTKYQNHATSITKELTSDEAEHKIVVLGGDGTINEVVNGIRDLSKVILGYIPTGSSNDFSRAQKIPKDPREALRNIFDEKYIRSIDIGVMNYPKKRRRFVVSAGIGFDAAVCHQAVISKMKVLLNRIKLGKLTYVGIALNRLIYSTPTQLTLTVDNKDPIVFENTLFAATMNHCYEGGGIQFSPKARPDDKLLDIVIVNNVSLPKILLLLPLAFFGKHTFAKEVHIHTCHTAIIETARSLPVHCDGEPVFQQRIIKTSLEDTQLRIFSSH
ncbi:diacylglycerol kinase family lipid kinase [Lachnospiraceae bacterium OttesenSCG-928-E19]|nr:diacylglycerol kinase family lipid kinase [Lachnospiraceae bacterium OttesenSCG-928-E19]